MSTVLKPEEILFRVLFFFRRKPRQLRTFVKLLPLSNINNLNSVNNINSFFIVNNINNLKNCNK